MVPLAFDAVLLFALSIPLVMQYRIFPVAGTPYGLFGILFLLLSSNILLSLYPPVWLKGSLEKIKTSIMWIVITIVLGGITVTAIVDRNAAAPIYGVHDIILQQEAAMRYLLAGKNPYKEDYFGTPLEAWHYGELGRDAVNPALYHFVMPPWYLLFPFIFYFLSVPILGFFDGRMVLLFCMILTLFVVMRWFTHPVAGRLAVILLALAPGIAPYFIEGRSDAFALVWLVLSMYLLERKSVFWSAVMFGLALMSKQTIWFAVPFYFLYVWHVGIALRKPGAAFVARSAATVGMVALVIAGPFLWWDARAFMTSVVLYLSGGTPTGYPISGYGLGMLLYGMNIIKDIHAYYPFVFWQLGLGIPTIVLSLRFLGAKLSVSRFFVAYAVSLFVIWYVSRYFNNSHVTYIGSLLILGVLKDWDERLSYEKK